MKLSHFGHFLKGFLLGVLLAFGFHHTILIDLGVDEQVLQTYKFVLAAVLGLACAVSEEVQCVGLICTTMFCSRSGRRTVQAMILALLITGPGKNMIHNTKEVVRTFGCSAELAHNISKDYVYLTITPFTKALLGLNQQHANAVATSVQSVQNQIGPLQQAFDDPDDEFQDSTFEDEDYPMGSTVLEEKYQETEDDTDGDKLEKKLLKRIEKECVNTIKRSSQNCKQIFADHFEQCEQKLSPWVSWIMCWPMRVDYVCDLTWLVVGKAPCDAKPHVQPGFGSAMNTLANSKHQLKSSLGNARFHYKIPDPDVRLKVQDVASSMQNITAEVHMKAQGAEKLLGLMTKIVALMFLPTILESVKYVKNYLQRPSFDNYCITSQFELIDSKREKKGIKPVLLPFRALEKKHLVLESDRFPNGPEKKGYLGPCIRLTLLFLVVFVVFSTDYIFYKTLKVVEKHGKFHMTLTGNHTLHIRVVGTGFVAQFIRSITSGFNSNADAFVNQTLSNVHCLPQASSVEVYYIVKIVVLLLCLAAFILSDHVPKRIRRKICAFYYPLREKQRIVHLYNKLLVARIHYRESTRKNLQVMVEELRRNKDIGIKWPFFKRFPFLKLDKFFYRSKKCCFCNEQETADLKLYECAGCNNDLNFCSFCWKENESKCVLCLLKMNIVS